MTNLVTKVRSTVNDSIVIVFNLMVESMSAERQFDLSKMGLKIEDLPSASRKLIQEKIFPKEFMNNYSRLRDRAIAVLERGAAVQTQMGYITSRTEAVLKITDLNAIKADWEEQIKTDSTRYATICNERISFIALEAYKEGVPADVVNKIVTSLRKRQPEWDEFVNRMKFNYLPTPIGLEIDDKQGVFDPVLFQSQKDGLVALREGVFGSLVQYLVRESSDILKVLRDKRLRSGAYTINYRTVGRIGSISEKLHGLAFIHKHIAPLAKTIDEALAFMPKSVDKDLPLSEPLFLNLTACLEAMSDQHELLARLRDKLPLVEVHVAALAPAVSVQQAPIVAVQATVATASSTNAPTQPATAVQVHATIPVPAGVVETDDDSEETPTVEPVVAQNKFMGLGFMGNSLFD